MASPVRWRALARTSKNCLVYAIEGTSFEVGAPLSDEVARATEAIAPDILLGDIERGDAKA
jgi:hypothetical protein